MISTKICTLSPRLDERIGVGKQVSVVATATEVVNSIEATKVDRATYVTEPCTKDLIVGEGSMAHLPQLFTKSIHRDASRFKFLEDASLMVAIEALVSIGQADATKRFYCLFVGEVKYDATEIKNNVLYHNDMEGFKDPIL